MVLGSRHVVYMVLLLFTTLIASQIADWQVKDALYNQFKLDQPWDSPHNKTLGQTVVRVFQVPGRPSKQPWETYLRTFAAPKNVKPEYRPWLIEGDSKGPSLAQVPDGTSNTIMVAEAGEAVPWTKPDDLPYDGLMALPKLGGH